MTQQTRSAKDEARKLIEQLPEDTTWEEIQYRIYVRQKVERGLDDVRAGRVVPIEEVEKRLAGWLEP